jgi:hypothetical protein
MSIIQGGFQGITIYKPTATIASIATKGIRNVSVDIQPEYADLASGKRRPVGFARSVSFDCVDFSVRDQLKTWADDLTDVHFVLVGRSRCFQGYDNCFVNLTDIYGPYGDLESFRIELVNTKFAPTWYPNTNLLWSLGWDDGADSGDVPDNYTLSDTTTIATSDSFASNTYTLTWSLDYPTIYENRCIADTGESPNGTVHDDFWLNGVEAANNYVEDLTLVCPCSQGEAGLLFSMYAFASQPILRLYADAILPFPGLSVTVGSEFDLDTGTTEQIGVEALDASGSSLGSSFQTLTSGTRHGLTYTLPADTYKVRVYAYVLKYGDLPVSGSTDIKYPSLRVDGISAETLY